MHVFVLLVLEEIADKDEYFILLSFKMLLKCVAIWLMILYNLKIFYFINPGGNRLLSQ